MKQSWVAGLGFALLTVVMWGIVPIAVQQVLKAMDAYTLVWYRFLISSACLFLVLFLTKQFPRRHILKSKRLLGLLFLAGLGLAANFVLFSFSLNYLTATAAQVIVQLSPMMLMVASVIFLKERMYLAQIIGAIFLLSGLLLFFNEKGLELITHFSTTTKGILLAVISACVWVMYALIQKVMLRELRAQQVLFLIYVVSLIWVTPLSSPTTVMQLTQWQLFCLIFCGLNTVIGYGALVEAMARWQAAQVSAIITLTPICSLLFGDLLWLMYPDMFQWQDMNTLAYIGAGVVVVGAMFAAIGDKFIGNKQQKSYSLPTKSV